MMYLTLAVVLIVLSVPVVKWLHGVLDENIDHWLEGPHD